MLLLADATSEQVRTRQCEPHDPNPPWRGSEKESKWKAVRAPPPLEGLVAQSFSFHGTLNALGETAEEAATARPSGGRPAPDRPGGCDVVGRLLVEGSTSATRFQEGTEPSRGSCLEDKRFLKGFVSGSVPFAWTIHGYHFAAFCASLKVFPRLRSS